MVLYSFFLLILPDVCIETLPKITHVEGLSLLFFSPHCSWHLTFCVLPVIMHPGKQKDSNSALAVWGTHREVWLDPSALEIHGKGLFDTDTARLYFLHVPLQPVRSWEEKKAWELREEGRYKCIYGYGFPFLGLKSQGFLPKFPILAQPNNPIYALCVTFI